jgi:hypothetical protein
MCLPAIRGTLLNLTLEKAADHAQSMGFLLGHPPSKGRPGRAFCKRGKGAIDPHPDRS